ncbi:hypothetical protein [Paraburkholderia sp. BCC1876]|uniref:hypothetical protein n=1 Tax=Paraburkholderia sp. BCC1876 TaxID=2676303 RepID=UPI0015921D76|nr:hypothetical protein [Paraburkholderia sp. BCC1876]
MSRTPLLPSGRRQGLPFVVPDDWTPEQALAVFELLDDILDVVRQHYARQLHESLHAQRANHGDTRVRDDPPF